MRFNEQQWLHLVRRLDAAYSAAGREALAKMSIQEVHILHAEKMVDVRSTQAHLRQFPQDELGQVRHAKAEHEAGDIAGFLKSLAEKERKHRGPEMERE